MIISLARRRTSIRKCQLETEPLEVEMGSRPGNRLGHDGHRMTPPAVARVMRLVSRPGRTKICIGGFVLMGKIAAPFVRMLDERRGKVPQQHRGRQQ